MEQKIYVIELERWGIDGSPEKNSEGINQALAWAAEQSHGYTTIEFPPKEYLISEHAPIVIKNMKGITIDFHGAVLQMNTNALRKNRMILMQDCYHVRLVNGTVSGDIDTHDYQTDPGTTEGNLGILLEGGVVDCQIDNMIIQKLPGWGIVTSKGANQVSRDQYIYKRNLESGSINLETGEKINDPARIRTYAPIDLGEFQEFEDRFFILGYDLGYMGNPYLQTMDMDVVFYDRNQKRIGALGDQQLYKKVALPEGALFADIVLHQAEVPMVDQVAAYFTYYLQVTNLQVTNCTFDNNKSLGMAICGGDHILVKDCSFKNTGTLAPAAAIDIEDGWDFITDVQVVDNIFENNMGDVLSCAGDRMVLSGNQFWGNVVIYDRSSNYKIENNTFHESHKNSPRMIEYGYHGDCIIRGNTYQERNVRTVQCSAKGGTLIYENETLTNAGIGTMMEGIALVGAKITSTPAFTGQKPRIGGTYRGCELDTQGIFLEEVFLYDCVISGAQLQGLKASVLEGCVLKRVEITTNSIPEITVKKCKITDSVLRVNTWAQPVILNILDNQVEMSAAAEMPFIYLSAGRSKDITFKGNTVTNESNKPVFNMYDTTYVVPDGKLWLENNQFIQSQHPYIFNGVTINRGIVYYTSFHNQIEGTAEMLKSIYRNNAYFIIDEQGTEHQMSLEVSLEGDIPKLLIESIKQDYDLILRFQKK